MNNYWTFEASDNFLVVRGRVTLPSHEWNFAGTVRRALGVSPATQAARIVADIVAEQQRPAPDPVHGIGGYGGSVRKAWEKT